MFKFWGIQKNILLLVLTPTLLVGLVLSTYFILDRIKTLELAHVAKGKMVLSSVSLLTESLSIDMLQQLQLRLSQFRDSDPDILAIAIFGKEAGFVIKSGNDRLLAQIKTSHIPEQDEQHIVDNHLLLETTLLHLKTSEPMYLAVILNRHPLMLENYRSIFIASIISLLVLSISIYIAYYLSRSIGKPLQRITDELQAINEGKLDVKLHKPDIPELAKISDTINSLTHSLQLSKENMQQNVDQATSDLIQTLETIEIQNIELDLARKQAVQASHAKSEFLANISHEIRTPMNGVLGFTNLLLKTQISVTQKDYLLTIRQSANSLLSIIEDILDFSKIEAGKMTLDKITYSLRDCVEEVITLLSPSSIKKNIELIPLIYKNVPEQMLGDPIRVRQILTNLVSNAIKFTEKGSIVVRILLEEEDSDSLVIRATITDTGIGMTDEQITKLFQPFSQVNQSINRHHSGTGLGLVICKKLVEQMGGEITVNSKSNEGTSFSFTLRSEHLSQSDMVQDPLISLSSQPVMLYDSHPMSLLAMKQLLCSWDMDVHDFQSMDKLQTALKKLDKNNAFNPIIMIGLSEQNRLAMDNLAKLATFKNLAIFILGNAADHYDINQLRKIGADQFLEKPLTRKQLRKSFEQVGLIKPNADQIEEPHTHHFSHLTILVVDDNPANLKLIAIVLEEMSIDVIQAYDGLSAVEICKEKHFDLIFMDIRMPGLDGIEASQRIHKESLNPKAPIIALTAHAMAGEKALLLAKGLDDYMTKPISTFQLQQIISKWTGQIARLVVDKAQAAPIIKEIPLTNSHSINWDDCLHISGGREALAQEMLADLISAIPEFKLQLESDVINDTDDPQLLSNVHKFHGLACYTGVTTLQKLAAKFEKQLRAAAPKNETMPIQLDLIEELTSVEATASDFLSVD